MNARDAGIVGKRLATAAIIAASGFAIGVGGAGAAALLRLILN